MKLPASLKALKYVAQGRSFAIARQLVKDRRYAKSLAVPGLDKALFAAKPKQTAKTLDAWDEKLSAQPPLLVGIADHKFFDALRLQRKTVLFADKVPSCKDIFRGGLAFDGDLKVSVKELVGKLSKVDGKKADR